MNGPAIGNVRRDRRILRVVAASAIFLAMLPLISRGATAAGGDFSADFAAAAPASYTHTTGGGAWNDGTNAEDKDIREELEGGQFTCADTVTYLMKLDVDAGAAENQVIELDFSFLANTTGQPGAAHADVTGVSINYGDVENGDDGGTSGGGPGTFGLDSAIDDDRQTIAGGDTATGGSTASIVSESFDPSGTTPFNGADELLLTVRIDDLDAGETVVLRIDTTLDCDPGSRPTGNLQAKFESGRVVEIDGQSADEPLTGGAQTIPLKKIGGLTPQPTPAEIQVEKVTVPANLPDGFDFTLSGDDDQTITGLADQDGPLSFDPVDAGTYTVAETEVPGFTTSASCDNLDTQADEAASPVDLDVAAEETWRCTFVNTLIPDLSIDVVKSAEPETVSEPGEQVVFTASVTNTSVEPLEIVAVDDSVEGGPFFDVTTVAGPVSATTCNDAVGTVLDPEDTYECDFTLLVTGQAGDVITDEARFSLEDEGGDEITDQAPASVSIADVPPSIEVTKGSWPRAIYEPGMDVTYIVDVTNTSSEPVSITSITDAVEGGPPFDVAVAVDPVLATTCGDAVGTVLAADGGTYNCQFVLHVTGDAHELVTDVVTVTVEDDDGSEASDEDDETIRFLNVNPTMDVTKTADPTSVPEPGAEVTYTASVTNTSPEPVWVVGVVDSVDGGIPFDVTAVGGPVLATTCDDAILTVLAADGGTYTCTFTLLVAGDAGDLVEDVVAFTIADDDNVRTTDMDDAVVAVTDVEPTIEVDKAASVDAVDEPGEPVTFTASVTNTSHEPVTITKLTDTIDGGDAIDVTKTGDVVTATTCDDAIGTTLDADGGTYTCSFTLLVSGNAGDVVADLVEFTVVDNDDTQATDDDPAQVTINDLEPTIDVDKTTSVDAVDEPGAPVTFTASVTNTSFEPVTITKLTDTIDGGDAIDVTTTGDLVTATTCNNAIDTVLAADGGVYTCTFTLRVTGDAGDVVTDLVEFTVVDNDDTEATDDDPAQVAITDVEPTIEVNKADDDATVAAPGADVPYTVTVTNTSIENVTITSITDEIGDGEAFDVTTVGALVLDTTCGNAAGTILAPGESYTCTFTVGVTSDEEGSVTDVVRVSATDDDGNQATAEDHESTPVTPVADLAIDKTIAEELTADGAGTYLLTVTNLGPSTGSDVELLDELPDGLTITTVDAGAWDCDDSTATVLSCSLESLAVGTTAAVSVQVDVATSLSGSTVTNEAEVTGAEPDDDLSNNRDEIDATLPVLVLPTQQPTATPAPPAAAAPVAAAAAPVAAAPAARTLAVTGRRSIQLAMLAVVLLITGGALFGFTRGRRAARLDG